MRLEDDCYLCVSDTITPNSMWDGHKGKNADITKLLVVGHFADSRVVEYGNWIEPFSKSMTGIYFKDFLSKAGLDYEDMNFVNAFRCLTTKITAQPQFTQLKQCMDNYLTDIIEKFDPKIIVTWGQPVYKAFQKMTGINGTGDLEKDKGILFSYNGSTVFSMYHPSYAIRWDPERDRLAEHFSEVFKSSNNN